MMIYMFKKAGNYEKARKLFSEMAARGVPRTTITYNSLMSFETNYKEVSKIYDQVHLYGLDIAILLADIVFTWLKVLVISDVGNCMEKLSGRFARQVIE